MMQRLQRIDAERQSSSSSRHNPIHVRRGQAQHHKLSREELLRRWKFLVVKMRMLMAYVDQRRRLIFVLGLDAATLESSEPQGKYVLRAMMRGTQEEGAEPTDAAPAQRPNHARIIGQEVMGKYLGKSEHQTGTPVETVENCPHNETDLKRRACPGGKRTSDKPQLKPQILYWFTCMKCHGRWERSTLHKNHNEFLSDADPIDFQCAHFGTTYLETFRGHEGFCHYVLATINQEGLGSVDPGLRRFGRYLLMKKDHEQVLHHQPQPGQTPEKPVTAAQVDKTEYPSDWGEIETEVMATDPLTEWSHPKDMSTDDEV